MDGLINNLYSDMLREIIEEGDLTKLQEAATNEDGESFEDSLPVKSAIAIFSFSWWSVKFIGELNLQV